MFCDRCGAEVQEGQAFCRKCGKNLVGYVQPANRIEQNLHLLGILWIVYSILPGLGGLALLVLADTLFNPMTPLEFSAPPGFRLFLSFVQRFLAVIALALLVKGIAGMAAGYGLLQRAPWARITAIVVAFLAMLNIPLGTALGVYTVWVLLSPGADVQYQKLGRPVSA